MEIKNVQAADLGKYRCQASNIYGTDNSIAELNFESKITEMMILKARKVGLGKECLMELDENNNLVPSHRTSSSSYKLIKRALALVKFMMRILVKMTRVPASLSFVQCSLLLVLVPLVLGCALWMLDVDGLGSFYDIPCDTGLRGVTEYVFRCNQKVQDSSATDHDDYHKKSMLTNSTQSDFNNASKFYNI